MRTPEETADKVILSAIKLAIESGSDGMIPLGFVICLQECIGTAISQARRDGAEQMREAAGKVCDVESAEYKSNAMKCDAGGNTFGGTMDSCGALACERVRDNIIALPLPGDEPKEPDHAE